MGQILREPANPTRDNHADRSLGEWGATWIAARHGDQSDLGSAGGLIPQQLRPLCSATLQPENGTGQTKAFGYFSSLCSEIPGLLVQMGRVHVFGDEAGDLVFRPAGNGVSKHFIIGTASMEDCSIAEDLAALRREFAWTGLHLDQFHATEDKQRVRDRVFEIIADHDLRFDATIYEKRKARPYTYADPLYFYKLAWYLHFKHVAPEIADAKDELLVVASSLQIKRKRKTTKAAIHQAVMEVVNQVSPTVACHCAFSPAQTDPCLQVADYMTWAIQRKHESGDTRSYDLIKHKIESNYNFFKWGDKSFF